MREGEARVQFDGLAILFYGPVRLPRVVENQAEVSVDDDGKWIELMGLLGLGERLLNAAHRHQIKSIPLANGWVCRVQLDGPFVFFLRARPVPLAGQDTRHRGMSLREGVVSSQGLEGRRLCSGDGF